MNARIEKSKRSHDSSSVGFYPDSFDNTQDSYSTNQLSNSDSLDRLFAENNPVRITCWRENIYAELALFAHEKLRQSAFQVPIQSPKIQHHDRETRLLEYTTIRNKLRNALFFHTPTGKELYKMNQQIISVDLQSGRNYQNLMNKARRFREVLESKGVNNCEALFKECGINEALAQTLSQKITLLSPVTLLMFLFLVDKYPTASQNILIEYFEKSQQKPNSDCYATFKRLSDKCYNVLPTKTALSNYASEENSPTQSFQ